MKVLFLGTASAEGYPATFCNCENCRRARAKGGRNLRARSSVLINNDLLIDFSPEVASKSIELGVELWRVKALLITHSHEDHFYQDELRLRTWPFAIEPPKRLTIIGSKYVIKIIRRKYKGRMRELRMNTKAVDPFESVKISGYEIIPLPANHGCEPKEQPLIYIVRQGSKSILYACDTGPLPDSVLNFLGGLRLDAVIVEATLGILSSKIFQYHMGFEDVIELKRWMEKAEIISEETPFIITHFSHVTCPLHEEMEDVLKPYGITPAYDGFTIEI